MDILKIAITQAGGIPELAKALGVVPSAVGNWKARGLPRPWQIALALKYRKAIREAKATPNTQSVN